jgi:hypothetical protein
MTLRNDPSFLFELRYTLYIPSAGPSQVLIRAWEASRYDADGRPRYPNSNHTRLDCELRYNGQVIFAKGDTYCATPGCIDDDDAKELVTSLFCMKPGDTDSDYFESYTPEQLAWVEQHADALEALKYDRYGER